MISFKEFLNETKDGTKSLINCLKDNLGIEFIKLKKKNYKIKIKNKIGSYVYPGNEKAKVLSSLLTNTELISNIPQEALKYKKSDGTSEQKKWNDLTLENKRLILVTVLEQEKEKKEEPRPVSSIIIKYFEDHLDKNKTSRDSETLQKNFQISDQDINYFEKKFFEKHNRKDKQTRIAKIDKIKKVKDELKGLLDQNDIQIDDSSYEAMEQTLIANGIEIPTYTNQGKELDKDIANTLDATLDPKKNKPNIKVSDETREDKRFIKALSDDNISIDKLSNDYQLLHAEQTNNNDQSDIEVKWTGKDKKSDKRRFYIEAKLDYDSAPVSHFDVYIKDNKIKILDEGKVRSSSKDKQDQLDAFELDLGSQEKISKILIGSKEFTNFTTAYAEAIERIKDKVEGIEFKPNLISKEEFKKLAAGCTEYINYYKEQYRTLLEKITNLGGLKGEPKDNLIKAFQKYFPTFENGKVTDDEGLIKDKEIEDYLTKLDENKRTEALQKIMKIRNIHNKFTIIMESTKRNIDSLQENDKALFMLWAFILKSKNQRSGHIILMNFDLNQEDNSRRLLAYETNKNEDTEIVGDLISKYYGGLKDCAYIQIGSDTFLLKKGKEGKDFDPLGIAEKYKLKQFSKAITNIKIELYVKKDLSIQFITRVKCDKGNDKAFATKITGGDKIKEITY